jgi:hypothetical protein
MVLPCRNRLKDEKWMYAIDPGCSAGSGVNKSVRENMWKDRPGTGYTLLRKQLNVISENCKKGCTFS